MRNEEEFLDQAAMRLYRKGKEIFDVVHKISELIPDNDEPLQSIKANMIADAAQLTVKVAGACRGDLYDIRMESAVIIRKAARDLMITNHSLEMFGFKEVEYFQIVRNQIEEYRLLFIDWISSFDQWNYIIDRWGLFNPPGISPYDKDPDDDLPFDTGLSDDD